jgi:hypothetical protein
MAVVDLPPLLPAEHGRGVGEADLLDGRFLARVQEGTHSAEHQVPGIARALHRRPDPLHQVALHALEDGTEQVLLVGEVVVEGAPGHLGAGTISSVPTPE